MSAELKITRPLVRYHSEISVGSKQVSSYNLSRQGSVAGLSFFRPALLDIENEVPSSLGFNPGITLAGVQARFSTKGFCFMSWTQKSRHFPAHIKPNLRFIVAGNGCHLWVGALNESGYGIIGTTNYGNYRAHRVAYEQVHGPIADDTQLDHKCRVRRCINPDHLEPLSNAENSRRGAKAKLNWDKVREIRELRRTQGLTFRCLAKMFDVSSVAINNIIHEKRWKEGL